MSTAKKVLSYREFVKRMTSGEGVATPDGGCPVGIALDVFRGRWKADVLYRLCSGVAGFGELQRQLPGVTRAMLSSTLKELECEGVIRRRALMDGKVKRSEYTLTEKGKDLYPVFYALMKWGWKHSQIKGTEK